MGFSFNEIHDCGQMSVLSGDVVPIALVVIELELIISDIFIVAVELIRRVVFEGMQVFLNVEAQRNMAPNAIQRRHQRLSVKKDNGGTCMSLDG